MIQTIDFKILSSYYIFKIFYDEDEVIADNRSAGLSKK